MRRTGTIGSIGIAAGLLAGALGFGHPASAAAPPPPPVMAEALSDDPTAGIVGGFITAPRSSTVSAQIVMSSAEVCPRTMSGPGITPVPVSVQRLPPLGGDWFFFGGTTGMQAGWWVYGTTTVDGETSAVSDCLRIRPGTPTDVAVQAVTATTATLSFTPSLSTTSTKVQVLDREGYVLASHERGGASPVTVDGLTPGTIYRFCITPVHPVAGDGDTSVATPYVIPPFRSWQLLTEQQFLDFAGRAPTSEERSEWGRALVSTTAEPDAIATHIAGLIDDPNWGPVQAPVTRLYQAYFTRLPDKSGLAYWSDRRRSGTRAALISQRFATSTEFRRRYGQLGDRTFVERVYQNVLGRTGDAAGIAFWTDKLATGAQDRGRVMLGFSESSEFVRRMAPRVDLVNVVTGMVRRPPTNAEAAYWVPTGTTELDATALIEHLFASAEYDARVG